MRGIIYVWSIAVVMVVGAAVFAQAPAPAPDLTTATLEELMNIEITSVSKKEEKLFRSAAAIYVITQEEIRRSGLTSIPELLRLAPGLQVGRIDGNKWAITSRGFNGRLANKLLALIDGRSLYSPESAGVYWEAQLLPVEEIERIEVIRGPGGTLWGANAVNGVINIITKHAGDSQGGLLTVGSGSEEQGFVSARYDTKIGEEAFYRVYARYFKRSGLVDSIGRDANDGQTAAQGGFRLDWQLSKRDTLTVHGDIYDSHLRETSIVASLSALFKPPSNTQGEFMGGNVTGRWARAISDHSDLALQIYFDRSRREVYDLGERFDTLDVDLQYNLHLGRRQEIVSGIGYRLIADRTNTNIGTPVQLDPKARTVQIFSGFVQDEFTLIKDHLRLTLGSKLEHNDYNGFETQPNVRLLWTPSAHQVVWAAVSRAVRTPTRN
ncbi:MAG TPA: TonB-dependent receptor, partial [Blastocatellia bacterium]|nr:TonB-dependent receptor [Blastocatellia bacterium]